MKRVRKPVFFIVLLLILALTYAAIAGVYVQRGDFKDTVIKGIGDIRWGIDIKGGVEATFTPAEGVQATPEQLEAAKSIIEVRMTSSNITDYDLFSDSVNNRIIVRFPWKSDEAEFDAETAIEELAATALLTFREGDQYLTADTSADGSDNVILEGSDVISAQAQVQQEETTGAYEYMVGLEFNESGKEKFAEATTRLVNQTISIWMDDIMISSATVQSAITDGRGVITGDFTPQEATDLANKIQAGALPFALTVTDFSTISPLLGASALDAMALAGIIAFAAISLFVIILFRLPGFISVIALAGQMGLTFAAISGFFPNFNSFTMTLPGIAGIILSVGMGVDANIITASRIKEELRNGKSLDGAIQRGCENSFWAIFDGNITVLIVSIMLLLVFGPSNILSMIFGESTTGAIYSFGFTLLVGTIGNFIMGVFAARLMLRSVSGFKFLRKKWLYGGAGK